jgi:hypothetical protein
VKYRSISNVVGLISDAVGGVISYPYSRAGESRGIKWSPLLHIKSLINNVNSQGSAYFNSIPFIYSATEAKYINESY